MSDAPALAPPFPLTPGQEAAVATTGRNVYVTAAAGSGKTAVLTERVFRLIVEPAEGRPPIALEQLLIITFTRKAAQEMRERIERRLAAALDQRPDSSVLRAALDSLPRSSIMTIDAFCDRLVRRHFHLAGVSPTVRLADEDEEREIVHLATREVFEASALGEDGLASSSFADLLRSTPAARGGLLESLEARVDRLRAFVASLEDGHGWMASVRRSLEGRRDAASLDVLPGLAGIGEIFRDEILDIVEALVALANRAVSVAGSPDEIPCHKLLGSALDLLGRRAADNARGSIPFLDTWRSLRDWFEESPEAEQLFKLHTKAVGGPVLSSPPLKTLFESFVKDLKKWRAAWFAHSEIQMLEAERLAAAQGLALLDLAEAVESRVQLIKRRRGLLSFADMQRRALDLLTDSAGPSALALQYREVYEAVLVDEYQDVSPLQDALIRRVSRPADPSSGRAGNLFIVGDVRQSIYRFRQAEPLLFRSRLEEGLSPADETRPVTLSLFTNFRSRSGVLHHVNELFRGLMDRRIGDVDMIGDALLSPGRVSGPGDDLACVEVQWLDAGEITVEGGESGDESDDHGEATGGAAAEADLRGIEAEARWIAARIRELEHADRSTWIPDSKVPGGLRPIRPSDCVILVRSLAATADTWVAELGRWNIGVRTTGGESLWSSVEGADLLAALRLVDQPLDDPSLAAVLRSPLAGFSDDDLLRIRMAGGSGPWWQAVWAASGRIPAEPPASAPGGDDDATPAAIPPEAGDAGLRDRLQRFFTLLDRWRTLAITHPAESVLDAILEDTRYEAHVLGGRRADAGARNIDELRVRMRTRERLGSQGSGLSDFLRSLQSGGGGRQEAEDAGLRDDPNAVELMTIHKSKGLEFPVVFLARMGQRYNLDQRSGALLLSPGGSLALAGVDPRRRVRLEPPSLLALHSRESRALRGEELRLLYVAMTRARERLILVASARGLRHQRTEGRSLIELGAPAPAFARVRAASPAALVGPRVFALHRDAAPRWLQIHETSAISAPPASADLVRLRDALADTSPEAPERWRRLAAEAVPSRTETPGPASISAPPPRLASGPVESAATPLKARPSRLFRLAVPHGEASIRAGEKKAESRLFDEAEALPVDSDRPGRNTERRCFSFDPIDEVLDPAARGTLAHAFLQHLDLRGPLDPAALRLEAERMLRLGLLGIQRTGTLDLIPFAGIAGFFASPLGRRIADRPGSVLRELPFTHVVRVSELAEGLADFRSADPDRLVTVQGIMDLVLDEGDRITLIDFKSNVIHDEEHIRRLKELYVLQLRLYADALRAAWNLEARPETWLVFLADGRAEPMNDLMATM